MNEDALYDLNASGCSEILRMYGMCLVFYLDHDGPNFAITCGNSKIIPSDYSLLEEEEKKNK